MPSCTEEQRRKAVENGRGVRRVGDARDAQAGIPRAHHHVVRVLVPGQHPRHQDSARAQALTVRLGRIDPDELDHLHLFLRHQDAFRQVFH